MKAPILYMVLPCYNEEAVLDETAQRLDAKFSELLLAEKIAANSRIVFVNDGSKDSTWDKIRTWHQAKPDRFSGLNLTRNRGHQNALLAGLMTVKNLAACVISMDADLQDDINAIDAMLDKFSLEHCDVVYGVRDNRETDTAFKRNTAGLFYKIMQQLGSQSVPNSADFRLMSARALEGLAQFQEVNLFLRGMVPLVGYKSDKVYYKRGARFAGESKYPLKKMISFAVDGITSASAAPMRLIFWAGLLAFVVAVVVGLTTVVSHFVRGTDVRGWASIITAIVGIGGLQLLALGIIGEYIGKIYNEVKRRPRYLIEEFLNDNDEVK